MDATSIKDADSQPNCEGSPSDLTAEQVYHHYGLRVYNVARKMLSNDCDAEDVTQEVLLQVVRKLPTFRGESAFPTWLHRVTVNAALQHRRKRAARDENVYSTTPEMLEESHPGKDQAWSQPDEQLLDRETRAMIERAIQRLPSKYRQVLILSEIEGLPNAAIAEKLGLTLAAVKSRLHRARLMMRDDLAPYFEDSPVTSG